MLSAQEQLQRKFSVLSKKLYDYKYIKLLGTNASDTFIMSIEKDEFKNKYISIKDYRQLWCRIEFPGHEIPVLPDSTNNDSSLGNTLLLYEVLPIEMLCLSTEKVDIGNIVLYKYKLGANDIKVLPLQVVNQITKGGISESLINTFIVAPVTDYAITNSPEYKTLVDKFNNTNNW